MTFQFRIPAQANHTFAKKAFDQSVGKQVLINNIEEGIITAVEVVDDGKAVLITVEV